MAITKDMDLNSPNAFIYDFVGTIGSQNAYECRRCGGVVREELLHKHTAHHDDIDALKAFVQALIEGQAQAKAADPANLDDTVRELNQPQGDGDGVPREA